MLFIHWAHVERCAEWLVSQGIIGDDDVIARVLDHPPINTLSVSDLPPVEHSDDEGAAAETPAAVEQPSVPPSPPILRSPAPPPAPPSPVAHTSTYEGLGYGQRPQAPSTSGRVSVSYTSPIDNMLTSCDD